MPSPHRDAKPALDAFDRIAADHRGAVLLRTARSDAENHRSYLFTEPLEILSARSLDQIPAVFARVDSALESGFYVAGFVSYEAGYHFEPRALGGSRLAAQPDVPLVWFGVYGEPLIASAGEVDTSSEKFAEFDSARQEPIDECGFALDLCAKDYADKVQLIRQYIERGDFYQANLTVNLRMKWRGGPAALFRRMIANQPVAYGALVNLGDMAILSASPELFFRRHGTRIIVRPMKGTVRRGRDAGEDDELAAWLQADEKNRAENVMIVDLLRNDLGRICKPGTIDVKDLFSVERYDELFQMTSTVCGELQNGVTNYELFRALFPCGSITGAPKIRTMQVIRELEAEPRGIACGAIGFFAPDGEAVFSVAIRTATLRNGEIEMRVGSGITWDSSAECEYEECRLKARFLTHAPLHFELIETMLWEDGYWLLDLHLSRLAASAAYFGYACDLTAVRDALSRHAADLRAGTKFRVRLTLERRGGVSIASGAVQVATEPATLLLHTERSDSADRFLRHKTTRRNLYDRGLQEARACGFDDALFRNERGEITECGIHNVLIEKDGRLMTPPCDCGVLPGVYRAHLLATRRDIVECVLTLDDVLAADRIFVCNSVRGLRAVRSVSLCAGGDALWTLR